MKKITLLLAALSFSLLADTRIYQCDMTVSQVKNDQISRPTKADFGAMVVDSGDQFYVVRGDEVLSSPYLAKRNVNWLALARTSLSTTNPTTSTAFIAKTKVSFSTDVRRLVNGSHNDWS
ncbi:TPA: hypothetical protein ACYSIB_004597 [Klebsiella variicola]|uniref:hypothetical protein n=1 Tax=Klebsiella variicola TaxID=244366 RepID=UPI001F076BCF|nr:hypothetical protein [Klebsiella variicola]